MSEKLPADMVPRAELERAIAEAVATERRKRRRVQVVLVAVAAPLALAAGICHALYWERAWHERDREHESQHEACVQRLMERDLTMHANRWTDADPR
jgi:hypothetical protein